MQFVTYVGIWIENAQLKKVYFILSHGRVGMTAGVEAGTKMIHGEVGGHQEVTGEAETIAGADPETRTGNGETALGAEPFHLRTEEIPLQTQVTLQF